MHSQEPNHRFDKMVSIVLLVVGLSALISAALAVPY
jgi:hypothetical protein